MKLVGFDLCRAAMAVEDVSAPEQSVLLVLAVMANENGQCWPPINGANGLTGKTKLSERSVQRAVQALREAGHIDWFDNPGRGRMYSVHPRHSGTSNEGTPASETPRQSDGCQAGTPVTQASTPVTVAPKQPITTNIPQKTSSSSGTRVRADFWPQVKDGSITASIMAQWPPGELDAQVEHFIDHHTAKGTISKDWQASWRTWSKNWKSFNGKRQPANCNGAEPQNAMFRVAQAEFGLG